MLSFQSSRPAEDTDPSVLAKVRDDPPGTGCGRIIEIVVGVPGNKQVKLSVAVVVAERRARRPCAQRDPCFFRHIGKGAVVIVVVEPVLAHVGDIQVRPSVVVVVAYGHAHSPTIVGDACLFRDVGKCAIVVVMKERRMRRGSLCR